MFSTLVAGHICLDLIPALRDRPRMEPGALVEVGPLTARAGGCVANTGIGLGDLGAPVRLAADVGADLVGDALIEILQGRGVHTSGLRRTPHATSYSVVVQPPGLDRTFWHHVGANQHFEGDWLDLSGCDLLHVGYPSILPALVADGGKPLVRLLERARRTGITTSVDLAVVDPESDVIEGSAGHERWRALFETTLPFVDVLSPSVDDVVSATGWDVSSEPVALLGLAERLVEQGTAVVTVSAGEQGMALATGSWDRLQAGGRVLSSLGREWANVRAWHPVEPIRSPVTTTGAGDAATAGLLFGILRTVGPDECMALAASAAQAHVQGRDLSSLQPQP